MNITGGANLSLYEVNEAADIVASASDPEVNMIFGAVIDENLNDEILVTVIATGFEHKPLDLPSASASAGNNRRQSGSNEPPAEQRTSSLRPFGSSHASSDQLDIPTFLRNRRNTDR